MADKKKTAKTIYDEVKELRRENNMLKVALSDKEDARADLARARGSERRAYEAEGKAYEAKIRALTEQVEDSKEKYEQVILAMRADNERLNKAVDFERSRMTRALEVADNAAQAAGSIGRVVNSLATALDSLGMKIEQQNREDRRR
jgi:chromosome segregation ATPase